MLPSPPAEMNHPPTSKRKRNVVEAEDQDSRSFSLTSLTSNATVTFEPLTRLLRAHLPLSWLAAATNHDHLLPGALLQGSIPTFHGWEYAVLVARELPNGGLFVLEKLEHECFVVHALKPFVSEKWICDAAVGAAPGVTLQMMLHYLPVQETLQQAGSDPHPDVFAEPTTQTSRIRKGAAARLSILNQPAKIESSEPSPVLEKLVEEREPTITLPQNDDHNMVVEGVSQGPADLTMTNVGLDTPRPPDLSSMSLESPTDMLSPTYLRQRYLDHLYMTKTSLAYYTKGPLSRARARARAPDSSMHLPDLAEFYRSSILPVKRIDLKYKESIRTIVQGHGSKTSEEKTPRKATRKTKLGKDGLWPIESDFVIQWWETRALKSSVSPEQHAQEMQDAISSLRMREAQMQMVLMLEALSIEAKQKEYDKVQQTLSEAGAIKIESVEQENAAGPSKTNLKRHRNLEADLEVIADRLCIWHSIGLEGSMQSIEPANDMDEDDHVQSKDRLRHFCTDVLIPFYSSRLPQLCKALCRTLAGSEVFEQAQKAARFKDASKITVPGAAVPRRVASMSGKDFARIVGEDSHRQASPPTLIRSSTLPPLPKFKREASELSHRPPSRSSRQPSINLANREIDLVADAKATATKKRKLDRVASHKQDLAAAIEALKRPNRQHASNAYMDEVERRRPEARSHAVQITATPSVSRRRIMDGIADEQFTQPVFSKDEVIMSSGQKPRSVGLVNTMPRASVKKKAVLAAIHDTPSKGSNQVPNDLPMSDNIDASLERGLQSAAKKTSIFSTPVRSRSKNAVAAPDTWSESMKRSIIGKKDIFELPDVAVKTMDRAMVMSVPNTIYETLGWDDDYVDDV